jgi:hypothetical protein
VRKTTINGQNVFTGKDFLAGVVFILFGGVGIAIAWNYPKGTAWHMGPGYFPSVISVGLVVLGICISARSFWMDKERVHLPAFRPLLVVVGGVVAFGLLLQPIGFLLSNLILIVISRLGGSEFRLKEVILLYLVFVSIAVVVFIYFLGVQISIWPF